MQVNARDRYGNLLSDRAIYLRMFYNPIYSLNNLFTDFLLTAF